MPGQPPEVIPAHRGKFWRACRDTYCARDEDRLYAGGARGRPRPGDTGLLAGVPGACQRPGSRVLAVSAAEDRTGRPAVPLNCRPPAPAGCPWTLASLDLPLSLCREARRLRQEKAPDGGDQMAQQMKRAADSLAAHPYRVHDGASAQNVHGCGPAIAKARQQQLQQQVHMIDASTRSAIRAPALWSGDCKGVLQPPRLWCAPQIICTHLFAAHPPAPLSEEEREAEQRQAAAIKAAEVCSMYGGWLPVRAPTHHRFSDRPKAPRRRLRSGSASTRQRRRAGQPGGLRLLGARQLPLRLMRLLRGLPLPLRKRQRRTRPLSSGASRGPRRNTLRSCTAPTTPSSSASSRSAAQHVAWLPAMQCRR